MKKKTHTRRKQSDPATQKRQNYLLNEVENLRSILGVNDDTQDKEAEDTASLRKNKKK